MYLAQRQSSSAATITELSVQFNVSRNHLVKVVQFLSKHKILAAQRGRGGGLRLAAAPEQLRIGQLVYLLEQTDCVIDCDAKNCVLKGSCLLKLVLNNAYKEFIKALDQYTLRDVTAGKTGNLLRELSESYKAPVHADIPDEI